MSQIPKKTDSTSQASSALLQQLQHFKEDNDNLKKELSAAAQLMEETMKEREDQVKDLQEEHQETKRQAARDIRELSARLDVMEKEHKSEIIKIKKDSIPKEKIFRYVDKDNNDELSDSEDDDNGQSRDLSSVTFKRSSEAEEELGLSIPSKKSAKSEIEALLAISKTEPVVTSGIRRISGSYRLIVFLEKEEEVL